MEGIEFAKMNASGNDFIVFDNRSNMLSHSAKTLPELAKALCERRRSIGADGMLVIEDSKAADFKMRIINPDGSEVDMCGNGSRCVALYAMENGIAGKSMKIETGAGIVDAEVVGLDVKLALTNAKGLKLNRSLTIDKKEYKVHSINTGVMHAILFVNAIDKVKVDSLGSKIRRHKTFSPKGTNVDFVKVLGPNKISIRTYERGVESETYACGTGAAASAIISGLIHGMSSHIDVHTKGGEALRVYFNIRKKRVENIYLEGEARLVHKGVLSYV